MVDTNWYHVCNVCNYMTIPIYMGVLGPLFTIGSDTVLESVKIVLLIPFTKVPVERGTTTFKVWFHPSIDIFEKGTILFIDERNLENLNPTIFETQIRLFSYNTCRNVLRGAIMSYNPEQKCYYFFHLATKLKIL